MNNNTGTQRGKTEKTGPGPEERVRGLFFRCAVCYHGEEQNIL